jgi:hypothetical protein
MFLMGKSNWKFKIKNINETYSKSIGRYRKSKADTIASLAESEF